MALTGAPRDKMIKSGTTTTKTKKKSPKK